MKNHKFNIDAIAPVLSKFNVVGGWLFGSAASGEIANQSDIDIAVLFRAKPGLDELAECRAALQKAICFDDIELVVLNDASVILRFAALMGKRVLCADESPQHSQCYNANQLPPVNSTRN